MRRFTHMIKFPNINDYCLENSHDMARWSYSFVCTLHYLIIIIMQRIWKYWTSKMLVRYSLSNVCLRLSEFSIIFHDIYGAVSIKLSHCSCDDYENTYTSSYHHHQSWSRNHLPLYVRVRLWNTGMRCISFYVLMICRYGLFSYILQNCTSIKKVTRQISVNGHRYLTVSVKKVTGNKFSP